ncbi:MAG: glycerate kinase [Clostridia bacterium]|nr:glycerate kinase [Clostridia bacterium]
MNVVIAIDSFKGSLTSWDAGTAAGEGLQKAIPNATVRVFPVADGGEGTVEALVQGLNGRKRRITALDPLGRPIECEYGILDDTHTAIIEMSAAAGIFLLTDDERDPLYTTTYGVGQLIADALENGCRHFIVGIGGSATNDGGAGMLQALGFALLDKNGTPIPHGAIGLKDLAEIKLDGADPRLRECTFCIACDVKNPLCGENGCSAIFGPQKGATPQAVAQMDEWLRSYAQLASAVSDMADKDAEGVGAAGGIGFAFKAFLNGELVSGIDLILREIRIEEAIKSADLVITGEGRLDAQTVMGKAPFGIASLAQKYKKPVVAFSGCVTPEATVCNTAGIDAFFPVLRTVTTLAEALDPVNARANMVATAEQVFRLYAMAKFV